MKRLFAILFFLVSCSVNAYSYSFPTWSWGHTFNGKIIDLAFYNDCVYTVGTFSDSSFILGTDTIVNHGGSDVMIIKWDTYGNIVWKESIYGPLNERVSKIKMNSNNELIIFGDYTSASIVLGSDTLISNGGSDVYIAKYDLNGNFLNAHNYGTVGNDVAYHLILDYNDNMYAGINGATNKYDSAGVYIATLYIPVHQIQYSAFDSTIVSSGTFSTTITYGSDTITAIGGYDDVFLAKTKLDGTPVWMKNMTNFYYDQNYDAINVNETNGNIYLGFNGTGGLNGPTINYRQLTPFANILSIYSSDNPIGGLRYLYEVSRNDNILSMLEDDMWLNIHVFNINTNTLLNKYVIGDALNFPYFQLIRDETTIYTLGHDYHNNKDYKFGRIGSDILAYIGSSNQTIHQCVGDTATLTGNIYFGLGTNVYDWAPTTGLNNTNTNSVSFTATSNISYTLTVTDSTGHVKKDTFNIVIDTPLNAVSITPQFPVFCSDSMQLYSNMGFPVTWLYYVQQQNYWQSVFPASTDCTIYFPAKYSYQISTACGIVSDTIEILPAIIVTTNANSDTLCTGQSVTLSGGGALTYSWTGGVTDNISFTPLATQTYTVTGINATGCIDTACITIVVNPITTSTTNTTICSNQTPYNWNGQNLLSAGTYTHTTLNIFGCDSISILNLTVNPSSTNTTNTTICLNQIPYTWNGQNILIGGTYTDTSLNVWGCDSIAILNLTVNPTGASTTNTAICPNQIPYTWNGQNLTISGIYTDTTVNVFGCDSISILNLTVNPSSTNTTNTTICDNQTPYSWNGQNLLSTGTYTYTTLNVFGCDSIATLNLTVNPITTNTANTAICANQIPYIWNGQNILSGGTYTDTNLNVWGCDSVATLNLTVNQTSAGTSDTMICASQIPFSWNGQSLQTSGTYAYHATNTQGCDSLALLNLTVNPSPVVNITPGTDTAICVGVGYILNADSGFVNYDWTVNADFLSFASSVPVTLGGSYILTCTDTNGCTASDVVHIERLPAPNPVLSFENYNVKCSNVQNVQYRWLFNGLPIAGDDSVLFAENDGVYKIIVTDSLGCEGSKSLEVQLNIPSDNLNAVSMYPNPTSGEVTISYILSDSSDVSITLYDINGRVVQSFLQNDFQQKGFHRLFFNLDKLGIETGVYFFKMQLGIEYYIKKLLYH